ncbi:hypothetical protein HanLR1_Chr06g0210261 [Helianthus annuus]|nr:hypothetical protein HanLR1_Chr06g0210261 [Helianthus annuus]
MAPLIYTRRTSAYISALTQAIDKKLLKRFVASMEINRSALDSPTQRRDLLQELFADIALEVDDRARGNPDLILFLIMSVCLCSRLLII